MILCITNQCNRRCSYCFEGAFKSGPERSMSCADVEKLCAFGNIHRERAPAIAVMGGEPTLHPEFIDLLDIIHRINRATRIQVLTNLLCEHSILTALAGRGIGLLANVSGYPEYSPEERARLHQNLSFLRTDRRFRGLCLAVTITHEDQDFGFLCDILESDNPRTIGGVRVAIACPGMDFANDFPHEPSFGYGEKYLEIVQTAHRIRPTLAFSNECYVNQCMMAPEVYAKLEPVVRNLGTHCVGNLDILPGFSTHWCFAFEGIPEMSIKNIFDYRDMNEVRAVLRAKARALEKQLDRQCDTKNCTSLKCPGPCPAMKYYMKYRQGHPTE